MANTKKPEDKSPEHKSKPADKATARPKKAAKAGEETAVAAKSSKAAPEKKAKKPSGIPARRPLMDKTYFAPADLEHKWRLIDASKQPLGRLSSQIAMMLMGKDKPNFTRFTDTGDFVIVVNAKEVVLTGNKWADKLYKHHTGYVGGLKTTTADELRRTTPEKLIEKAVYGMLPYKGHMARKWFGKLRVFAGSEHPHAAQKPETVNMPYLGTRKEA